MASVGHPVVGVSASRVADAPRLVVPLWALAALAGYALVLFAPQVLNDGDTFSHIATGQWILAHGAVPQTDPFSFTFAGRPWVAHEWLSEVAMALAFQAGGWTGVVVLFGAATALALALMARFLRRWLDIVPAAIALMLGAACIGPGLLARPHILALPVLVAWVTGLLGARERGRVPWGLLPLMLLWANLHGSFVFGIALAAPFALEAVLDAGAGWRPVLRRWGLFGLAAVGLAMATPQGWRGILFPFQLTSMQQINVIDEWRAPNFQEVQQIEFGLMAALFVCLSRGVRVPACRVLVLLGVLHLALQHVRHEMLAGVVGALVLAEPIGRALTLRSAAASVSRGTSAAFLGAALALTAARVASPVVRTDGAGVPIRALDHVPASLAGRPVLNDYGFGGYLIFRGVRPFIDGRADMFGDAFLAEYRHMMRPDPALIARTIEARGIAWTLFAPNSPALPALDALPGWHRLYADATAVVHVRDGAP